MSKKNYQSFRCYLSLPLSNSKRLRNNELSLLEELENLTLTALLTLVFQKAQSHVKQNRLDSPDLSFSKNFQYLLWINPELQFFILCYQLCLYANGSSGGNLVTLQKFGPFLLLRWCYKNKYWNKKTWDIYLLQLSPFSLLKKLTLYLNSKVVPSKRSWFHSHSFR